MTTEDLFEKLVMLPPREKDYLKCIKDVIQDLPEDYRPIMIDFQRNMRGVWLVLLSPFIYTRVTAQLLLELNNERANGHVTKEFMVYLNTDAGQDEINNRALGILSSGFERVYEQEATLREILLEGVVMAYGTLEVLAKDTFIYLLNRKPELLDARPTSKKSYIKHFNRNPWKKLKGRIFSVQDSCGDQLCDDRDSFGLDKLIYVLAPLLPDSAELDRIVRELKNNELESLRHEIVHRRGVRGDGTQQVVTKNQMRSYVEQVKEAGILIAKGVAKLCASCPPQL